MTSYKSLTPYKNHQIEDFGGIISPDFKSFARKWKNFLKVVCESNRWELAKFNVGHYYCSWFIKNGEKYIYCSFGDVRYFSKDWYNSILFRTAKHDRDYTGGRNWSTPLESLESSLKKMFEREQW